MSSSLIIDMRADSREDCKILYIIIVLYQFVSEKKMHRDYIFSLIILTVGHFHNETTEVNYLFK